MGLVGVPILAGSQTWFQSLLFKDFLLEEIKGGHQLGLNLIRRGMERRSIFRLAFAFAFVIPQYTRVKCKRKGNEKKNPFLSLALAFAL